MRVAGGQAILYPRAMLFLSIAALAQPAIELHEGPTLLQPCLDIPLCMDAFSPPLAEALTEVGYALHNEGVATSALGSRGTGAIVEVGLHTMPIGPKNEIQERFPPVPAIPRFALGGTYGMGGRSDPGPQFSASLHGLPRVRVDKVETWAIGGSTSAAVPLERHLFVGGELSWTRAAVEIPLIDSVADLRQIDELKEYIDRGKVLCADPCVDRMVQNTVSARLGAAVEPIPEILAYARGGFVSHSETLYIALDGSSWRLSPVVPEFSFGAGFRAGGVWQTTIGATTARRPPSASTEKRSMTRLVLTTAARIGPRRPD